MNKLITDYTGGFPFLLNDLRFVDDSIRQAIKDIVTSMCGEGPVILYGCQITQHPTYISVTEGAIFWSGEIWHVYPHNFTAPNPLVEMPSWYFVEESGPQGSRTFENAEIHQVHQIRKAIGSYVPIVNPFGSIYMDVVPRYLEMNNSTVVLSKMAGIADMPGRKNPSRSVKNGNIVTIDAGFLLLILPLSFVHIATITSPEHFPPDIVEGLAPSLDNADPENPSVLAQYKIDIDGKIYLRRFINNGSTLAASIRLNLQYVT